MSRDGTRDVRCGDTRAILVSSESPRSLGHEYHDEYGTDPASREFDGGWCFVPWAGAGSRCTRAENMLPLCRADGRSRRRFHPAISPRLTIWSLHPPAHHHHITREITAMLATTPDIHNANAKSGLLLEHHIVFSFGRPSSQMRKHGSIKMPLVSMKQRYCH